MTCRFDWLENVLITTFEYDLWPIIIEDDSFTTEYIYILNRAIDDTKRIVRFLFNVISISFRMIGIDLIFVRGWLSGIDPTLSLIKSRDHIRYFSFVTIRKVKDAIQVRSYIFKWIVSIVFSRQRKTLLIFSRKSHRSYIRRRRSRVENSQQSRIRRSIR